MAICGIEIWLIRSWASGRRVTGVQWTVGRESAVCQRLGVEICDPGSRIRSYDEVHEDGGYESSKALINYFGRGAAIGRLVVGESRLQ